MGGVGLAVAVQRAQIHFRGADVRPQGAVLHDRHFRDRSKPHQFEVL
jgi:hypothetical protein